MPGEAAVMPERTRHLAFGDVAAAWGMLEDLGVAAIIDEAAGPRRADAGASVGHVPGAGGAEPAGRAVLEAGVRGLVEDHCRGPVHQDPAPRRWITAGSGTRCTPSPWSSWSRSPARSRPRIVQASGVDCSSVALDMTNFATFIATGNGKAPVAQRGKAKQKRTDLRLVGLGLVVTRDGGIPLTWHAYPGDRPDVTQFPAMITPLAGPYEAVCAAAGPARSRGHDRGLRRRAELRGQLRAPGRDRAALHRVGARHRTART